MRKLEKDRSEARVKRSRIYDELSKDSPRVQKALDEFTDIYSTAFTNSRAVKNAFEAAYYSMDANWRRLNLEEPLDVVENFLAERQFEYTVAFREISKGYPDLLKRLKGLSDKIYNSITDTGRYEEYIEANYDGCVIDEEFCWIQGLTTAFKLSLDLPVSDPAGSSEEELLSLKELYQMAEHQKSHQDLKKMKHDFFSGEPAEIQNMVEEIASIIIEQSNEKYMIAFINGYEWGISLLKRAGKKENILYTNLIYKYLEEDSRHENNKKIL